MPAFDSPSFSVSLACGTRIFLDRPGGISFVSHAHSDHSSFVRESHSIIASEQSIELMKARGHSRRVNMLENYPKLDGAELEMIDAGHVLGARQLVIKDADGTAFAYTGDFNPHATLTCPKAQVPQCDELVVECTYGNPRWVFPSRESVYGQVKGWVEACVEEGQSCVLGGYSLGKAQELIAILNQYCGITPVVEGKTGEVCKVYCRHGVKLDFASIEQAGDDMAKGFVAVVPIHTVSPQLSSALERQYGRPVRTAVATGWALNGMVAGVDEAFALSDHADFPSLLRFVEATGAKKVWCVHGFANEFAYELRKKGIHAGNGEKLKEGQMRLGF
ncbi:hypothetical protein HY995_03245 [Candidatus Micrarchaeota archaeon]|nr:hypothetical protein [Candidatus Micrarchaeota archaeon]